ncbi:membrane bound O-acyl transferase family-domain-containing protein [Cyathus striatus]|nr:membrane bound O-acyl transferase family-domain-containing protein [Cyathus striatus]
MPIYIPDKWHNQISCGDCTIRPNTSQAFMETYTAATYHPDWKNSSIAMEFEGIAIYVYFILPNKYNLGITTYSAANFTIDGQIVGSFSHSPDLSTTKILYNQMVFSKTDLPNGRHQLVVSTTLDDMNVFICFDYAIYTQVTDESAPTGVYSNVSSPTATSDTPVSGSKSGITGGTPIGGVTSTGLDSQNSGSSKSRHTTVAIIGAIIGGIILIGSASALVVWQRLGKRKINIGVLTSSRVPWTKAPMRVQSPFQLVASTDYNHHHTSSETIGVRDEVCHLFSRSETILNDLAAMHRASVHKARLRVNAATNDQAEVSAEDNVGISRAATYAVEKIIADLIIDGNRINHDKYAVYNDEDRRFNLVRPNRRNAPGPHLYLSTHRRYSPYNIIHHQTIPISVASPPPTFALSLCEITQFAPATSLDDAQANYGFGCLAAFRILIAIQCILLLDVQNDLRRKVDEKKEINISGASLKERFKWALDLFFSIRGVGWTHEPTSRLRWIPSQVSASKFKFIMHQLWRIAVFTFLCELFKLHSALNPYLHREGPSFYEASWGWRMTILTTRILTYVGLSLSHAILSVVFVVLGVSNPGDWPTLHGSWKDAYTVRRFWGRSWHQMFRHTFQTYGKFVSGKLLGLPPNNSITTYVELYTAFILSGIIHAAGDYRLFGSLDESGSMRFFFLQAVIITVEDGVCWIGKCLGVRKTAWWLKYLGYAWVTFWFTWTLPIWMEPLVRMGIAEFPLEETTLMGPYNYLTKTFTSLVPL